MCVQRGLDESCAAAGGNPFQACYLVLNTSAADDGIEKEWVIEAKRGVLLFGSVATQCCGQAEQRGKGMQWDLLRHRVYVKTTCHSGL